MLHVEVVQIIEEIHGPTKNGDCLPMTNNYQKALITGGAGFIGSHITDALLNKGFEVTVLDNLDTGRPQNIAHHKRKEDFHFIEGDIRDQDVVREAIKDIDVVFHEAALASVTLSVKNPILTNDINLNGTLNLLRASTDFGVKRFIYASSAAVYGKTSFPRKNEKMTPNPTSPYGISKLSGEYYVRLWFRLYGLETISLRYFNVYGPRQRFDIQCAYGGAITIFTNRLLKDMPPIVFGDGKQTRDFVYIDDVVGANLLALESKKAVGEVFNVGTGINVSVDQVAKALKTLLNKEDLKNIYTDPRPTDIRHGYADITKAKEILGYNPKCCFKKGLTRLVNWYIKEKIPDKHNLPRQT